MAKLIHPTYPSTLTLSINPTKRVDQPTHPSALTADPSGSVTLDQLRKHLDYNRDLVPTSVLDTLPRNGRSHSEQTDDATPGDDRITKHEVSNVYHRLSNGNIRS